jgi:hypothetical protein
MRPVALGVWQETLMGFAMNTWKDVGGSNVWVRTNNMTNGMHEVWWNSETKYNIWSPGAQWYREGNFKWHWARVAPKAKAKADPKAKAAGKAKAKAAGKAARPHPARA